MTNTCNSTKISFTKLDPSLNFDAITHFENYLSSPDFNLQSPLVKSGVQSIAHILKDPNLCSKITSLNTNDVADKTHLIKEIVITALEKHINSIKTHQTKSRVWNFITSLNIDINRKDKIPFSLICKTIVNEVKKTNRASEIENYVLSQSLLESSNTAPRRYDPDFIKDALQGLGTIANIAHFDHKIYQRYREINPQGISYKALSHSISTALLNHIASIECTPSKQRIWRVIQSFNPSLEGNSFEDIQKRQEPVHLKNWLKICEEINFVSTQFFFQNFLPYEVEKHIYSFMNPGTLLLLGEALYQNTLPMSKRVNNKLNLLKEKFPKTTISSQTEIRSIISFNPLSGRVFNRAIRSILIETPFTYHNPSYLLIPHIHDLGYLVLENHAGLSH